MGHDYCKPSCFSLFAATHPIREPTEASFKNTSLSEMCQYVTVLPDVITHWQNTGEKGCFSFSQAGLEEFKLPMRMV